MQVHFGLIFVLNRGPIPVVFREISQWNSSKRALVQRELCTPPRCGVILRSVFLLPFLSYRKYSLQRLKKNDKWFTLFKEKNPLVQYKISKYTCLASMACLREQIKFLASITVQRWCIIFSHNCLPTGKWTVGKQHQSTRNSSAEYSKKRSQPILSIEDVKWTIPLPVPALGRAGRCRHPFASESTLPIAFLYLI